MAGTNVVIDDDDVVKAFNQLVNASGDLTEVLTAIGLGWDSFVSDSFDKGIDPYGDSWVPSERALETGDKTLVDHGHLRDSFHPYISKDGKTMVFGSDLIYAATHQFGSEERNISARPILPDGAGWPDEWRDETLHMIEQHLENSFA
jgi:phage gpG-like protein